LLSRREEGRVSIERYVGLVADGPMSFVLLVNYTRETKHRTYKFGCVPKNIHMIRKAKKQLKNTYKFNKRIADTTKNTLTLIIIY
jgi:hypothetical protein